MGPTGGVEGDWAWGAEGGGKGEIARVSGWKRADSVDVGGVKWGIAMASCAEVAGHDG